MTAALDDPAVRAYLASLDRLLDGSPERALVVDGVAQHIDDALAGGPAGPEQVRAVLDELGDPATIAGEATISSGATTPPPFLERRSGAILTVLLLTVGGFVVPLLGWVVGLGLLWSSKGWTVRDKLVATFGPAVLTALLVLLAIAVPGANLTHLAVLVGLVVGAVAVAVYLLNRFQAGGRR